ncbi:substrate-binding domain-containing protein [Shewanella corallii]|uniref:Substrate-binding domain-containing protein n=1 Tax=Shewanella corallii TaxID=560080 RepID=A0ABT0NAX6_9GAMM|nr:substrate-binding domain-containing protein [Shewanella corallii]MCL2915613.1 substrate-binding domain-containing protein [Shewanella corallii]
MTGNKLTLAGLAKLAGVSTSTASRALHNNPLIKAETRQRIQDLAKTHNFSLNAAASRLRSQKTNVIAVILNLDYETEQSIDDPFLLKVVGDINQAVNQQGYELLLSNSRMAGEDWYGYFVAGRRADGVIVVGQGKQQTQIERAFAAGTPLVAWGDPSSESDYPVVGSDNFRGGQLAATHLLEKGAGRILFLGDPDHAEIGERYRGCLGELEAAEACLELLPIDLTSESAYRAINLRLQSAGLNFDGVFACSDMVAFGAMKALKERYVSVPNDVRIVGFDNIAMAEVSYPSLTTIAQNTRMAAQSLVSKLLIQLEGDKACAEQLPIELICRQSS